MNKPLVQKCVVAIAVLAVIAIAAAFLWKPRLHLAPAVQIDTTDQPLMGNQGAKVHIVVFEDLKCIACKQFNNTVLPRLKEKYIDPGIANYTMINLAFIPGSMPAANAARCLYKENPAWFFEFTDDIYQHQPPESENWAIIPKLTEFASHIPGVDQEKLSRCIFESPYTGFMINNFKMAKKLQGDTVSTPAVYVNGHPVETPSLENIEATIQAVK